MKLRRKLPGPFIRNVILKSKVFAVTPDAKFIIYGGAWDASVRVYRWVSASDWSIFLELASNWSLILILASHWSSGATNTRL